MMNTTLVGIDVSAKTLSIFLEKPGGQTKSFELHNKPAGHRKLIQRLARRGQEARVVLEASGTYHLDLAMALHKTNGIELMVVNPRAARDFAKAFMNRSKTDALDASVLREFARRMPFRAWQPPATEKLHLRCVARRIGSLIKTCTQEKNRLHAASQSLELSDLVSRDIEVQIRQLRRRIQHLRTKALDLVWKHPNLRKQLAHLTSLKGIGQASAVQILGELCVLPKDMTPRQWVAYTGLDPRLFDSGDSVHAPPRMSRMGNRYLRAALFMPALTAIRHEPNVKAFYEKLIGKQKAPRQAIVAVMRKLVHAIHGMLRTGTDFEGEKFYVVKHAR